MKPIINFLLITQLILCFAFGFIFIQFNRQVEAEHTYSTQLAGLFAEEQKLSLSDTLKRMPIYDKGIQMVRGSYLIPHNWLVYSAVHTTPFSNDFLQNVKISFVGPQGEMIYSEPLEIQTVADEDFGIESFKKQLLPELQKQVESLLEQVNMDTMFSDQISKADHLKSFMKADSMYQYLEISLTGSKDKKPFEGLIRVLFPTLVKGQKTTAITSIILAPDKSLEQILDIEDQIAFSYQPNPAFDQYVSYLNRRSWYDYRDYYPQEDSYYLYRRLQ